MKKILFSIVCLLTGAIPVYCQCNTALVISQGRPAIASSVEGPSYQPDNAFDGDRTTRWSSAASDPQYLYVDLGVITNLCQVELLWEAAYGKDFTIDFSNDAITWTTVATITGNTSLTTIVPVSGSSRYVRMYGTARGTPNGYSLFGMRVYGTAPSPSCSATNLSLSQTAIASSIESIAFPASDAIDGNGSTRWSSLASDPQSIYVDLGATYNLCNITLTWEAAYATDFHIDVSPDALDWATLATISGNTSTTNILPVSGLARYVRMSGTARATMYGYSLYEFTVHGYAILPIVMSAFKASVNDRKEVLLQWTTQQEFNNDHVDVERSNETSGHFISIGTIKGGRNTTIRTDYTWLDSFPLPGRNIYRLKQVDIDGKYAYSSVTAVNLPLDGRTFVSVYPNPVTDQLTVSNPGRDQIVSVSLFTPAGVQLINYINTSGNRIILPMKGLSSGIYLLKVRTDQQVQSFKILKGY